MDVTLFYSIAGTWLLIDTSSGSIKQIFANNRVYVGIVR